MYTAYRRRRFWILLVLGLLARPLQAGPADDQFLVAATHYNHGRWQSAADEFAAFVAQYPDDSRHAQVLFFLGETCVQLQQYEKAREQFLAFLQRAPDDRNALRAEFRLGEVAFFEGQYQEARERLNGFHDQHAADPLNAYVLAYLGEMALAEADGSGAEARFREAINGYQDGPLIGECRFGLARALEMQGNSAEAIRFYRFLAENRDSPLADDAQLQLGVLNFKQRAVREAISALESFSAAYPQSELLGDAQYWYGQCLLVEERFADAATAFATAAEKSAQSELAPAIQFSLADALRKQGKYSEAVPHCQQVLDQWSESAWADDACQVLVDIAFRDGETDRAATLGQTFLDKFPNSPLQPFVAQTLGRIELKREQYAAAITRFESLTSGSAVTEDAGSQDMTPSKTDVAGPAANEAAVAASSSLRRANAYYLALALLGDGQYDAALTALDKVQPAATETELASGILVARASALISLQRYAEAAKPLRDYLAANPQGADAGECTARLCIALSESGDLPGALAAYATYREQFRQHTLFLPTTHYLAEQALTQNQLETARELFTLLSESSDAGEYAAKGLAGLGKTQLKSGQTEASAQTFATLVENIPDSPQAAEAALLRAKSLETPERTAEAITAYLAVAEKFAQSPQAPAALQSAAQLSEKEGKQADALRLLERLQKEYPDCPQVPAALYQQAWILADSQRQSEAMAAFRKIADNFPETRYWADAVYRLAEHAAQSQDYAAAGALLERLLSAEIEPDVRAHGRYLQARLAIDQQQWSVALPALERLLQDHPQHALRAPAEYWIAEIYYQTERYDEAVKALEQLAQTQAGKGQTWEAMVPLRHAQVLAQQGQWDQAFEQVNALARDYPDFRQRHEVDYLLGRCLSSQARFREAREAYQRVVDSTVAGRSETAAMAQWMVGETYFHQKDYDQAIRAYHRVESLYAYPKWQAAALLQAAKCQELQGNQQESIRLYQQLIKTYADTQYSQDAAERLKAMNAAGSESAQRASGAAKSS
jgi:TolA-binding protein